ncbi:MAG: (d)CMP kinase [Burkholderiales bacterium]|nr:(d)CMP kinase [Bacteroidia bacterium]
MSKITIAIDGYSSCGKSTLAKALAQKLNYNYIDTGAMYRAVTIYCLRNNIIKESVVDVPKLISSLKNIDVSFVYNTITKTSEVFLNGEHVEREIRTMEVANNVSAISSIKEVREKMVVLQREMGKNKGVIMDGRDIGSHVFPNAELKLFMTAEGDVRTQRRLDESRSKGERHSFEDVKRNLEKRDHDDTTRKENPLKQAEDAIVLDNTDISKEEQLTFVVKLINDLLLTRDEFNKPLAKH